MSWTVIKLKTTYFVQWQTEMKIWMKREAKDFLGPCRLHLTISKLLPDLICVPSLLNSWACLGGQSWVYWSLCILKKKLEMHTIQRGSIQPRKTKTEEDLPVRISLSRSGTFQTLDRTSQRKENLRVMNKQQTHKIHPVNPGRLINCLYMAEH